MLRMILTVLPTLQLGSKIKEAVERSVRQAIIIAIALVFILIAAVFGLFAGYLALQEYWGSTPLQAAGIVAASMLLIGFVALGMLPLASAPPKPRSRQMTPADGAARAVGVAQQQVGDVMQRLGPAGVLSAAFVLGLIFGRRR
jgi:hypothetical protein